MEVDLNADVGEGMPDDAAILDLVTSANIACGGHAGNAELMIATVRAARQRGVAVGAHPSYPDREHFGRTSLTLSSHELERAVIEQIGALADVARAADVRLSHVKPHGALYNDAARDAERAGTVARAVAHFDPTLILVGLAGSALPLAGRALGLRVAAEAFCDRAYEKDGSLRARSLPGALLADAKLAADQALDIATCGQVRLASGGVLAVRAQTLCIHGDTRDAALLAAAVRSALEQGGVAIRPLGVIVA